MIAEPLEKGLAEDIENEVVQITWNRYDALAKRDLCLTCLSCFICLTPPVDFPSFNCTVVVALLISPYFPAALTHQSASLFLYFAEMNEQPCSLRRRLL